ncbi:MAG TPA: hypothetical protein VHK88_20370 [Aquihabitans sp.]|nr:hypothetical protein [Aquihabitans sp.]
MTAVGTGTATVRVGVSGHRAHASPKAEVAGLVDDVLDGVGPSGRVVSSLAEGADRVVVERALDRGWPVDVVLPLAPDDYEGDFGDAASRASFRRLLAAAASVEQVDARPTRDEAYLAAGLAVLDRSDAVVVVWDGAAGRGVGGTADIVGEARARSLPLAWIRVQRDPVAAATGAVPPARERAGSSPTLTVERWPWAR